MKRVIDTIFFDKSQALMKINSESEAHDLTKVVFDGFEMS
jgi:hypothetical protein